MTRVFWYFWMVRSCFTITLSALFNMYNVHCAQWMCPSYLHISASSHGDWVCVFFFFFRSFCCPQIIVLQVASAYEFQQRCSLESDLVQNNTRETVFLYDFHFYFIFSACFAILFMITKMARHILPQLENKPQMTTLSKKKKYDRAKKDVPDKLVFDSCFCRLVCFWNDIC